MKIKDVMTPQPLSCTPDTTLAEAGHLMWEGDCGVLPVVEGGAVTGVVTDRDLFVALATRNARPADLRVGDVVQHPAVTCSPDDDVHRALAEMKARRIRRLPVVGLGGSLLGIVSMNDLLLVASPTAELRDDQVVDALQTICEHPLPVPVHRIVAA